MDAPDTRSLPENAYKTLPAGETYQPLVPAQANLPETSGRAIAWGVFLCVIFTVASAYSGLKVGQVMEAAIPISILAIGLARVYQRRSTILENVIITGIGGVSGAVVAGAIFTLPALYILKLDPHPWQTIFICLAGGCLGVLFLIPLRRYFVRETHGQFPYPEATAITEVLRHGREGRLAGETAPAGDRPSPASTTSSSPPSRSGRSSWTCASCPAVQDLADKAKMAFSFDAVGFILGLGYVMGLRSSLLLCAGGVLANFVLVPLVWFIGSHLADDGCLSGRRADRRDDGRRRSSAATSASSASARSPPPASSGSSSL